MGIRWGVVLTLLVLAGCGDQRGGGPSGGGTGSTPPHLDGTSWVATGITEHGATRTLVAGSTLRVDFDNGRISVNAGCNTMGASYRLSGDGRLTTGSLAATTMGCEQPLMDQDAWLSGTVFASALNATVDRRTLTLTRPGLELVLTDRRVASPDAALEGTTWQLDGLRDGAAVSTVPSGVRTPDLRIGTDGTVLLHTGCNSGGGTASVHGSTISFSPIVTTKMACADPAGQQTEIAELRVLDGDVTWSITEQTLTLTKGGRGLVYRAAR